MATRTHISSELAINPRGFENLDTEQDKPFVPKQAFTGRFPQLAIQALTEPTPRLTQLSPRSRTAQTRARRGRTLLITSSVTWLLLENTAILVSLGQASSLGTDPANISRMTQDYGFAVWFFATVSQLCVVGAFSGIGMMILGYADLFLDKQSVFEQHIEKQMKVIGSNIGFIQQAEGGAVMSESKANIQTGTGNFATNDGTVSNVSMVVTANLAQSQASDEVKELIRELTDKIEMIKSKNPDSKQAQNLVSDVQSLSTELAKSEPRKEWYQLSLRGIKEAAEALGEIATPVIGIAGKLVTLLA